MIYHVIFTTLPLCILFILVWLASLARLDSSL